MSEEESGGGKDIAVILGPQAPDGRIPAARISAEGATVGFFTPVREGESLAGREVIALGKKSGPGYEVETLYDGRATASGPAMVNSHAFRSGWDAVFAKKPDASLN